MPHHRSTLAHAVESACSHTWERPTGAPLWSCSCSSCSSVAAPCLHCDRPLVATSLTVCARCLERGQRLVLDVVEDMDRFPHTMLEVMGLRSARYDVARTTTSDDDLRLPFGMDAVVEDPQDTRIAAAKTPTSATDVLRGWASGWAESREEPAPWDWAGYLVDHTLWAMQNPADSAWAQYAEEAAAVRSTVRRLLGITPVRAGTPCPDCGVTTAQEWQPRADRTPAFASSRTTRRRGTSVEGLSDVVRCSRCRRSWESTAHLAVAAVAALPVMPRIRPAALLTFGQLVLTLGSRVPKHTLATWIRRGLLSPVHGPWPRSEQRARRRRDGTTERLYRLADADLLIAWDVAHAEHEVRQAWDAAHAEAAARLAGTGVARTAQIVASSS